MPRTRRKFLRRRIVFGKIRAVLFDARFLCDRTFFGGVELYNAIAEKKLSELGKVVLYRKLIDRNSLVV